MFFQVLIINNSFKVSIFYSVKEVLRPAFISSFSINHLLNSHKQLPLGTLP